MVRRADPAADDAVMGCSGTSTVRGADPMSCGDSYNSPVRCLCCHYDLSNLTEHRCPECGRAFDPADVNSYEIEAVAAFDRSTRFPYEIHRKPGRIAVCLIVALMGGFIANSLARGTPQADRWQLSVAGLLGALLFVPFLVVPVWWVYELLADVGTFVRGRLAGTRDVDEQ
jgi:hypothetical protein